MSYEPIIQEVHNFLQGNQIYRSTYLEALKLYTESSVENLKAILYSNEPIIVNCLSILMANDSHNTTELIADEKIREQMLNTMPFIDLKLNFDEMQSLKALLLSTEAVNKGKIKVLEELLGLSKAKAHFLNQETGPASYKPHIPEIHEKLWRCDDEYRWLLSLYSEKLICEEDLKVYKSAKIHIILANDIGNDNKLKQLFDGAYLKNQQLLNKIDWWKLELQKLGVRYYANHQDELQTNPDKLKLVDYLSTSANPHKTAYSVITHAVHLLLTDENKALMQLSKLRDNAVLGEYYQEALDGYMLSCLSKTNEQRNKIYQLLKSQSNYKFWAQSNHFSIKDVKFYTNVCSTNLPKLHSFMACLINEVKNDPGLDSLFDLAQANNIKLFLFDNANSYVEPCRGRYNKLLKLVYLDINSLISNLNGSILTVDSVIPLLSFCSSLIHELVHFYNDYTFQNDCNPGFINNTGALENLSKIHNNLLQQTQVKSATDNNEWLWKIYDSLVTRFGFTASGFYATSEHHAEMIARTQYVTHLEKLYARILEKYCEVEDAQKIIAAVYEKLRSPLEPLDKHVKEYIEPAKIARDVIEHLIKNIECQDLQDISEIDRSFLDDLQYSPDFTGLLGKEMLENTL